MAATTLDAEQAEALVLELLTGAAVAHGAHERDDLGGVYDEQWPQWYAAHIARALVEGGYSIRHDRDRHRGSGGPLARATQWAGEKFDLSGDIGSWDDWH